MTSKQKAGFLLLQEGGEETERKKLLDIERRKVRARLLLSLCLPVLTVFLILILILISQDMAATLITSFLLSFLWSPPTRFSMSSYLHISSRYLDHFHHIGVYQHPPPTFHLPLICNIRRGAKSIKTCHISAQH